MVLLNLILLCTTPKALQNQPKSSSIG